MNTVTPLIIESLLVIAGTFLLEFIFLLLFLSKKKINIFKILLVSFIANLVSYLFGVFIPTGSTNLTNYIWLAIAYVLAVIFEWLIYIAFFSKNNISNSRLLWVSIVINTITYIILGLLIYKDIILKSF